jgi:integrase
MTMQGHLKLRGKVWYAVLTGRDETGTRRVKFISLPDCKGKREAQQALATIIAQRAAGTFAEPTKVTLAEFLTRWAVHMQTQVGARTLRGYQEKINSLIPVLGGATLSRLRPDHISGAYAKLLTDGRADGRGGLSRRTVHHCHVMLKQALHQATVWQVISRNPAALVDPPKVDPIEMQTINVDQSARMIDIARGTPIFIPILLGVLCGLRRGEIAALRWRNVDLDAAQLSVVASMEEGKGQLREKAPKNNKGRKIALPPMLVSELRRHRIEQAQWLLKLGVRRTDDHHVCIREDGSMVWPGSIGRALRTFLRRHGLPQIRFHDLRHSHATHLLQAGVHAKIASERLGHSSIGITLDTYSHVLPGMQEDAVAKVDAAFQVVMNRQETK